MQRLQNRPELLSDPHTDLRGVLHDVSNTLTVLLGWVTEARCQNAPRELVDYALTVVERRARAARDLSRRAIGADSVDLHRADEADNVLAELVDALSIEAERAGVKLERRGCAPGVRVEAAVSASQVLTNLVLNAIAYCDRGGRVTLELVANDHDVFILVQDDGIGVPEALRQAIFEGYSSRKGGVGIGLAYARALARSMGGDLELLPSERGARFRLRWPLADVCLSPPPPSVLRMQIFAGRRILLVEDDADVVQLLETALCARGAHVTVARTSAEVNALPASADHDAALVDLSPIASDIATGLAAIRKRVPRSSIIFITGNVTGVADAVTVEPAGWVQKPFEVSDVVAAVAECIKKKS